MTQSTLKTKATELAYECKQGKCSLGTALLILQNDIAAVAKTTTRKQLAGMLPPGSWLDAYKSIRAETNVTFWAQYRGR